MRARSRVRRLPVAALITIATQLAGGSVWAQEVGTSRPAVSEPRDWDVSLFLGYGVRTLDGSLVINSPGAESGAATAQSLGLGNAEDAQVAINGRWKRLHFGLAYLPTTVTGQGYALTALELGDVQIGIDTPTSTKVDVNLDLLTMNYAIVQNRDTTLGLGLGLGRTSVAVDITPSVGQSIAIDSHTPFGFVAVELEQRLAERWAMSFAAHGAAISSNGDEIDYFDFDVAGGYRALDRAVKLDVVAGFRLINFNFDYSEPDASVLIDVQLRGPYVGLRVSY